MSQAEGLELVEEWTTSGLSIAEFSEQRGITPDRLGYWRRRADELAQSARKAFVVVEPTAPPPEEEQTHERGRIEVVMDLHGHIRFLVALSQIPELITKLRKVSQ